MRGMPTLLKRTQASATRSLKDLSHPHTFAIPGPITISDETTDWRFLRSLIARTIDWGNSVTTRLLRQSGLAVSDKSDGPGRQKKSLPDQTTCRRIGTTLHESRRSSIILKRIVLTGYPMRVHGVKVCSCESPGFLECSCRLELKLGSSSDLQ